MADQRSVTFGMQFTALDEAIQQLTNIQESIDDVKTDMITLEQESDEAGTRVKAGMQEAADGFRSAGTEAVRAGTDIANSFEDAGPAFREVGAEASSMGNAIARSAGTALKEYQSFPKTIKAGVQGAFGYIEKQTTSFQKKMTGGAKRISQAFKDPIGTIKNHLSDALENAGSRIKEVEKDAEGAEKDLEDMGDAGESAGTSIKDALGGVVGKFAALSAGIELVKAGIGVAKEFASSVLGIAQNTEIVGAKFEAVFAEDKGISVWANNFASGINRSKDEVKDFLTQNKVMYQEMGITGEAANDLSKMTTAIAYDFGTAFKMDDAEALSTVQDYLSGNTAALSQYGVQINDTVLQQTALSMGLNKNIEDLSDAEAAQVRMNALLENSTSIQEQAAGAQTGYANGIKSIKAKATDMLSTIGAKFTPAFDKIIGTVLDAWPKVEPVITGLFDKLAQGMETAGPGLINFAVTALPPLISTLQEVFAAAEPIGSVLIGLATTALPPLVSALAPVVSVIGKLAQTILPPFARIISMIATSAIPPLVEISSILISSVIEPVVPILENVVSALMPGLQSMLQAVSPLLSALSPVLEVIGTVLGNIVGFLAKIVGFAAEGVGTLLGKVAGLFGGGGGGKGGEDGLPHNASGTPDFPGGWTHINERGGEVAFLPGGSTIIPADKSRQLIGNVSEGNTVSGELNIHITIDASGDLPDEQLKKVEIILRRIMQEEGPKIFKKEMDQETKRKAIQEGYA